MDTSDGKSARPVFRDAWADGRRVWRQLLATDLAFKLLAFGLLTPLLGIALKAGIAVSGGPVLADMEILFFLVRPVGLVVLVAVAALSISIVALELACLMAIGVGVAEGVRVDAGQALRFALGRARPVVGLAVRLVGPRRSSWPLPSWSGLGLVYLGLLREFDINYYLKERPPVFLAAVGLAAALVLGLAAVLVPRLVGWSLALPLVLFEDVPPRRALAESARRTAGARAAIARACSCSGAASPCSSRARCRRCSSRWGGALAPYGLGNVGWVLGFMLFLVALWVITNLLVSWWQRLRLRAARACVSTGGWAASGERHPLARWRRPRSRRGSGSA